MDKLFKLKENNTSVRTEVVAGITTFMTMAYILAVNPSILSASGMDSNAILMATAIASAIGCFAMAFLANYPFALAPGLGLNAYFAYTVCGSMGYSWKVALFAVFVEGLVFIVLSLTNVREAIFNAIPTTLKKGVSVGIGLFVAFIGLQSANLVVASESTKVTVVNFRTNFNTVGIGALLAVIGTFIIAILYVKHVKGSILIGIVATWVLGIICQLTGLYKVDAAAGFYSLIPSWRSFDITAISLTFGQCFNLKGLSINILDFIVIMCSFLFVDMFDTLGTLIGVANKAKMLDENGKRVKKAGPSTPVEILGLHDVPDAGEIFMATENDKEARNIAETYVAQGREKLLDDTKAKLTLDGLFSHIQAGNIKELNIIVKADVQGSVEAVKQSLLKLTNEEVAVRVIHAGVGAINESDVVLASASNAIIIGFNVRPDATAKATAEREGVDVRLYKVIYQAIEDVEAAMKGMLDPIFEEKVIGHAEVRQIFRASAIGNIAGSYVLDGTFQRDCKVRITREGEQIYEGKLASLKRFKDDVKEVKAGFECGLVFEGFDQMQELDVVEAYVMVEVPR